MIVKGTIIDQPYSGEFSERIYDNVSPWNSQSWAWIKFLNDDDTEWIGQFRGYPRDVAVSKKLGQTIVLTADYIFRLNSETVDVIEIESHSQYRCLTTAPDGTFIFADYYNIARLTDDFKTMKLLEAPIQMDRIDFLEWTGNNLTFTCDEFTNWDRHLEMELDSKDWTIKIRE
ncbi:hypothetical protein WSM22_33010 [Cytophagales bacterium WSM2-2]|nr:hypothetical protein WSM22_33010 [Cytophagales bacterium WSM2-2]